MHLCYHFSMCVNLCPAVEPEYMVIQDNLTDQDPCFVDPDGENFQLKPNSPAYELGFKTIPVEKIGLYKDAYRNRAF